MKSELQKALNAYWKAETVLRDVVDSLFPVGCRVQCRHSSYRGIVKGGSLYADQVRTTIGHSSPCSLIKIEQENDNA